MNTPTYLAIDFETTGLIPGFHVPLEVCAVVLDGSFNAIESTWTHDRVYQPPECLSLMEPNVLAMHLGTGLVRFNNDGVLYVPGGVSWANVGERLQALTCGEERLILLGSNPTFDRGFLPRSVESQLHYRQLDVRSVMMALGPGVAWYEASPEKKHTAIGDVEWAIRVAKQGRAIGEAVGGAYA